MATIETAFEQVITPVTHDLGDFKVNRSLPARERTMVGPFIFVDEFGPARRLGIYGFAGVLQRKRPAHDKRPDRYRQHAQIHREFYLRTAHRGINQDDIEAQGDEDERGTSAQQLERTSANGIIGDHGQANRGGHEQAHSCRGQDHKDRKGGIGR